MAIYINTANSDAWRANWADALYQHWRRATDTPIAVITKLDEVDDQSSIFAFGRVQDRGGSRSTPIDAEATDPKLPKTKRGLKFRKMSKIAKHEWLL